MRFIDSTEFVPSHNSNTRAALWLRAVASLRPGLKTRTSSCTASTTRPSRRIATIEMPSSVMFRTCCKRSTTARSKHHQSQRLARVKTVR